MTANSILLIVLMTIGSQDYPYGENRNEIGRFQGRSQSKARLGSKSGFGVSINRPAKNKDELKRGTCSEGTHIRSWTNPDHWVLGDPEQAVWIAGLIFLVSFRVFRLQRTHHFAGCIVAIASAICMFAILVWNGYVQNSGRVLTSVLTIASFGYSGGTMLSSLVGWIRSIEFRNAPPESKTSEADALSAIHQELDAQLAVVDSSDIDADTKLDLKQTARDKAEEKMARIIESDNAIHAEAD